MKKLTPVFLYSSAVATIFILWGAVFPGNMYDVTTSIQQFLDEKFGWFYLFAASGLLMFSIYLIFSPYGNIKLGRDDDEPQYSRMSWFAMLFSAGMGVGLVFWGVAEPLSHLYNPPTAKGQSPEAASEALRYSFFHWGFHPWGVYGVLALSLAYFSFRKNSPQLISEIFRPLFGDKVDGFPGKIMNIVATIATVFGVATSLGLGVIQINGGLSYLTDIPNTFFTQLLIIIIVSVIYMISTTTGINKGMKYLSNINIALAVLLMFFILFFGPTGFILDVFTSTFGSYIQYLPHMSLELNPFNQSSWVQDWTIFYWSWWMAWAPFVGTFIARVSRGRTIREFVIVVLLGPTVFSGLWFSVYGGTAISFDMFNNFNLFAVISENGKEAALFNFLSHFPLGSVLSVLAICLIGTFFITSADSATYVLGMQSTNGSLHPPNSVKLIWGVIQSSSAAVLLWSGGLEALQTASIIVAFPFSFILIVMCISFLKALRKEIVFTKKYETANYYREEKSKA